MAKPSTTGATQEVVSELFFVRRRRGMGGSDAHTKILRRAGELGGRLPSTNLVKGGKYSSRPHRKRPRQKENNTSRQTFAPSPSRAKIEGWWRGFKEVVACRQRAMLLLPTCILTEASRALEVGLEFKSRKPRAIGLRDASWFPLAGRLTVATLS